MAAKSEAAATGNPPSSKCILELSENIATDWQELAINMDISKPKIAAIEADHPNHVRRRCFEIALGRNDLARHIPGVVEKHSKQQGAASSEGQRPRQEEVGDQEKLGPSLQVGGVKEHGQQQGAEGQKSTQEEVAKSIPAVHVEARVKTLTRPDSPVRSGAIGDIGTIVGICNNSIIVVSSAVNIYGAGRQCFKLLNAWCYEQPEENYIEALQTLQKAWPVRGGVEDHSKQQWATSSEGQRSTQEEVANYMTAVYVEAGVETCRPDSPVRTRAIGDISPIVGSNNSIIVGSSAVSISYGAEVKLKRRVEKQPVSLILLLASYVELKRHVRRWSVSLVLLLVCLSSSCDSVQANTDGTVFLERGQRGIVPCPLVQSGRISPDDVFAMYWYYGRISRKSLLISYFIGSVARQNGIPEGVFDIDDEFNLIIENVTASNEGTYYVEVKPNLKMLETGHVEVCDKVSPSRRYPTVIGCNQDNDIDTCEARMPHDSMVHNLTCVMEQVKPAVELRWIHLFLGGQKDLNSSTTVTSVNPPAFSGSLLSNTYSSSASIQVAAVNAEEVYECEAVGVVVGGRATHTIVHLTKTHPTTTAYDTTAPDGTTANVKVQSSYNPGTTQGLADKVSPIPLALLVAVIMLGVLLSASWFVYVIVCILKVPKRKGFNAVPQAATHKTRCSHATDSSDASDYV